MAALSTGVNGDEWARDLAARRTECGRLRSPGACQYGINLNDEWDRLDREARGIPQPEDP